MLSNNENDDHPESKDNHEILFRFPDISSDNIQEEQHGLAEESAFRRIGEPRVEIEEVKEPSDEAVDEEERFREIEKRAFEQGLKKGRDAGLRKAAKEAETMIMALGRAVSELSVVHRKLIREKEEEAVTLAVKIAEKIICREITEKRDTILEIVRMALSRVVNRENIRIKVNPADYEFLEETGLGFEEFGESFANVSIKADDMVELGGCIIETKFGDIDARIEKQLEIVSEALQNALLLPDPDIDTSGG